VGERFESGAHLGNVDAYDFNATIHDLVGVPQPEGMLGEVIAQLRT
jgi:hypothetical protein